MLIYITTQAIKILHSSIVTGLKINLTGNSQLYLMEIHKTTIPEQDFNK